MGHEISTASNRPTGANWSHLPSCAPVVILARLMSGLARPTHMALACLVALAGCGGGGDDGAAPATSSSTGSSSTAAAKAPASAAGLAKPLYPSCGVGRFGKPSASPDVADGAQYWQVDYKVPPTAPRVVGATTVVTIVEQQPAQPRGKIGGGHEIVVAGHKVSLSPRTTKSPSNVAQWKTKAAKYLMLADGTTAALKKIIACLP